MDKAIGNIQDSDPTKIETTTKQNNLFTFKKISN